MYVCVYACTYTHIYTYTYICLHICMYVLHLPGGADGSSGNASSHVTTCACSAVFTRVPWLVCMCACIPWLAGTSRSSAEASVCVCVCVCACRRVCLVELGPANFLGRAAAAPSRISQKSALQSYHKTNIVQYWLVRISRKCLWARRCSSYQNFSKVSSIVKPHSKYSSVLTFNIFSLVLLNASPQLLEEILKRQRATICTIQKDWWADFWEFFANSLG